MYREHKIAVVVPAYNEEVLILDTVRGIPEFVDKIVVVDDCSTDSTKAVVEEEAKERQELILISHGANRGVGGAISTGYVWCRDNDIDIAVVMAGDNQMDPDDLPALLEPVVEGRADYSKGNRLITGEAWQKIPRVRYLGNSALTFLTKIASGYWHVTDSQTGYTALNRHAMDLVPLEDIFPRYGMPNDFLVTLNIYSMRVVDVPVAPVYGIGEKSGIRLKKEIPRLSMLLLRLFLRRMWQKYVIRDFHPLVLFYALGFLFALLTLLLLIRLLAFWWIIDGFIPRVNALALMFSFMSASQFTLFAMWFDMESNKHLRGVDRK